MKCYYYHKKRTCVRRCRKKLKKHLEVRKNLESQDTSNSISIVDDEYGKEIDVFLFIYFLYFLCIDENFVDS